jgi:SAM-dependent methyltransferase
VERNIEHASRFDNPQRRLNVEKSWSFDSEATREYTKVRQEFARDFLNAIRGQLQLKTALDVGSGIGYFAKFLQEMGFQASAVDGREENTSEGRRRHPEINFLTQNVEDAEFSRIGRFDVVLCMGLLYHLENPFRVIRNLYQLTDKVLLVESMCIPGSEPVMMLLDEVQNENQGLHYVAFYPTESCLVKMLCRAGFPFVYRFDQLPADKQFATSVWRKRSRTFLAASRVQLNAPNLVVADQPEGIVAVDVDPWVTRLSRFRRLLPQALIRLRSLGGPAPRSAPELGGPSSRESGTK